MQIHALAGTPQYARHLRAVWKHLPTDLRGRFLTLPSATGNQLARRDVVIVAGWQDIGRIREQRVIYLEHGAGQTYNGAPASADSVGYHGNSHHPANVVGYLCPRQDVADSWHRPALAAGCPPLDAHPTHAYAGPRLASVSFHWPATLCAEAGSAFEHWRAHLPAVVAHLRAAGFEPVGHWHPRNPTMRAVWRELGVSRVDDIDSLLSSVSLVVADNTSLLYEAAALGLPVLALNSPAYRRDVHHGLRFWSHVPGWQIDTLDQLLAIDVDRYVTDDWSRAERESAVAYCYAPTLGTAGRLAADWIVDLVC